MGFQVEFNWVLKLSDSETVKFLSSETGSGVYVEKRGERLYPLRMPVELVDEHWRVCAVVEITEVTIGDDRTRLRVNLVRMGTGSRSDSAPTLRTSKGSHAAKTLTPAQD